MRRARARRVSCSAPRGSSLREAAKPGSGWWMGWVHGGLVGEGWGSGWRMLGVGGELMVCWCVEASSLDGFW